MAKQLELTTTKIQSWLDQLHAGNRKARENLISHTEQRLRMLAGWRLNGQFKRLARWEDIEDVLNGARFRLDRALQEVQPKTVKEFLALATQQIRRELLDMCRHHFGSVKGFAAHHHSDRAGGGPLRPLAVEGAANESNSGTLDDWTLVHNLVERLNTKLRPVFEYRHYHGLKMAEIAEQLGITEEAAKKRWQAAVSRLGEMVNAQGQTKN